MNPSASVVPERGRVIAAIGPDGPYHAFVPTPLPRELDLSTDTVLTLSRADMALGRLAGAGRLLPNPHLLLTPYILREAVSSSRIEGTQTSLSEVLSAQADGDTRNEDVREVQNYVAALELGLARLEALPISVSRRGAPYPSLVSECRLPRLGGPSHEKGQLAGIQWRATVGPSGPARIREVLHV